MTRLKREFPKLEDVGGVELLRCEANCRIIKVIDCEWSASSLNSCVGSQAKIYIRPIQRNASIESSSNEVIPDLIEECVSCRERFYVRQLRNHYENCGASEMSPGIQQEQQQAQVQQQQPQVQQQQPQVQQQQPQVQQPQPQVQQQQQSRQQVMAHTPRLIQPQWTQQENQNQLTTPLPEQQQVIVQQQQLTLPDLQVVATPQQNQIAQAHPMLLHLLTPENKPPLSLKMLLNLLKPQFSAQGSNQRVIESALYQKFVKYAREIAAGRRQQLTLGRVLCFVTAVEEEPPLGFSVQPSITFAERNSYLPTSNTCINKLILTVPNNIQEIPDDLELFDKFDYAFCNLFFGLA